MEYTLNVGTELSEIIDIIQELEEVSLLNTSRTFNFMNYTPALEKVHFDPSDTYLFHLASITRFMKKLAKQDKI